MRDKEELKPCPWCGSKPFLEDGLAECQTDHCPTKHEWYPETWNSAWCWKEIERLKAELSAEKEKVKRTRIAINECLDHWALISGPSVFEKSRMRIFLEKALEETE